ncbi:hypothetical protein BAE44_0012188 [Dichanthelium oligosanthes]|uniref:Uncharacterized protein n=1 Tax=Dichanthelium oligosanthes TaxID=888268 RepID=A0A1E5VNU9_9POAL|nr:hypothetical protein BAE44_0012188 [Dichanthelium oligosanthes]
MVTAGRLGRASTWEAWGAARPASARLAIDALAAAEHENDAGSKATTSTCKKKPVSTFVALAALGWTAFVRAKGLTAGVDTYLGFLADLRTWLDPPVADGYLGTKLWIKKMMTLPFEWLANVAASLWFCVYEASDFGFGRPLTAGGAGVDEPRVEMVLVGGRCRCPCRQTLCAWRSSRPKSLAPLRRRRRTDRAGD